MTYDIATPVPLSFHQRPANGAPFVYYCTELFHAGDTGCGSGSGGSEASGDGDDVDLDRVCAFVELVLDALDVQQVLDRCPHPGLYRGGVEPDPCPSHRLSALRGYRAPRTWR